MKNLFTAVVLGIVFAGVSLAHTSSEEKAGERHAGNAAELKVAVIEFSPGPNAPGMTPEAKRQLQASLAFALVESDRFDVVDVRRTRAASQDDLAAINDGSSTAAAVKLGKLLGGAPAQHVLLRTDRDRQRRGVRRGRDGMGRPERLWDRALDVLRPRVGDLRAGPAMSAKRWYPTVATEQGGDTLVFAGVSEPGVEVVTVERFDRASGAFATLPSTANLSMATYPRMFQLSDGRLVRVGQEAAACSSTRCTASWTTGPSMVFGQRQRQCRDAPGRADPHDGWRGQRERRDHGNDRDPGPGGDRPNVANLRSDAGRAPELQRRPPSRWTGVRGRRQSGNRAVRRARADSGALRPGDGTMDTDGTAYRTSRVPLDGGAASRRSCACGRSDRWSHADDGRCLFTAVPVRRTTPCG